MKVGILNGSPHKNGNTMRLVKKYIEGAETAGHGCALFDVPRMDIHPCKGCMVCKKKDDGCIQHDDMGLIYEAVEDSDSLVFATPMYWWNFTGPLKSAIDRLFAIPFNIRMGGHELEGKELQIIVTCGQPASAKLDSVLEQIGQNMCEYTGMKWLGIITAGDTGNATEKEWSEALARAYDAGLRLQYLSLLRWGMSVSYVRCPKAFLWIRPIGPSLL